MIDVEGLAFDYPSGPLLRDVGFVTRAGSVVGLVGPPGSGKSTLLRCIATLEMPGRGRITVAGLDTERQPREVHAVLGYVPPAFGLYDALTVGQCLRYAARSKGVAEGEAAQAAHAAATLVGLDGRMPTPAGALSGSERRRLALAQAVIHAPRVLLLDEAAMPEEAAEAARRDALSPLLTRFAAAGMTVVVSGPTPSALPRACTDLLELDRGRVVGEGVRRIAPDEAEPP